LLQLQCFLGYAPASALVPRNETLFVVAASVSLDAASAAFNNGGICTASSAIATAAYAAVCSFAVDLAAVVSSYAFAAASTISGGIVMVTRAAPISFAGDPVSTPAGSLPAAAVRVVAAAVA